MNDALNLLYMVLSGFFDFMFSAYFFDGVSLGMFFLVVGFFIILFGYVVAIPKMKVGNSTRSLIERARNNEN